MEDNKCSHCGNGYSFGEWMRLQMAIQECKKLTSDLTLKALKEIKEYYEKIHI